MLELTAIMSANSLIALVNQLQSMETSLAAIIFETVAKLTSLTSSSVFLLIESDGCRRFTGSPHLRDAFIHGGGLAAKPKDLQINVDLNLRVTQEVEVSALRPPSFPSGNHSTTPYSAVVSNFQHSPQHPPPPSSSMYQSPSSLTSPQPKSFAESRKRNSTTSFASTPSTSSTALSIEPSPKKPKGMEVIVKDEVLDQKPDLEALAGAEVSKDVEISDNNSEGGDSDIEILDSFFDDSSLGGSTGEGGGGGGGSGIDGGINFAELAGSSSSNLGYLQGDSSTSLISNIPCNQKKVDALRSIQDPMRAFQKVRIK